MKERLTEISHPIDLERPRRLRRLRRLRADGARLPHAAAQPRSSGWLTRVRDDTGWFTNSVARARTHTRKRTQTETSNRWASCLSWGEDNLLDKFASNKKKSSILVYCLYCADLRPTSVTRVTQTVVAGVMLYNPVTLIHVQVSLTPCRRGIPPDLHSWTQKEWGKSCTLTSERDADFWGRGVKISDLSRLQDKEEPPEM